MTKYVFKKYRDPKIGCDTDNVIIISNAITLEELAVSFENFVKACGFSGSVSVNITVSRESSYSEEG